MATSTGRLTIAAGVAAAVLAVAVSAAPIAQQTAGTEARPPARGRGPGPGGARPLLRGLDLTEAQQEQIKTITAEPRDPAAPSQRGTLQRELDALILSDTPDLAKIEQVKQAIGDAAESALSARVDTQLRIAQVLTAEQRKVARERAARTPAGRGSRGR